MLVFMDFEASSLRKQSYPIEVAWVFEDGRSETHLIRPAPGWDDWAVEAEAVHHISRAMLLEAGEPHDAVARRMVDQLLGHDLLASAPSWDGKWMSVLLRGAGLPRHTLRLRDSDDERRHVARELLQPRMPAAGLEDAITRLIDEADPRAGVVPEHRALGDALEERARWLAVRAAAEMLTRELADDAR